MTHLLGPRLYSDFLKCTWCPFAIPGSHPRLHIVVVTTDPLDWGCFSDFGCFHDFWTFEVVLFRYFKTLWAISSFGGKRKCSHFLAYYPKAQNLCGGKPGNWELSPGLLCVGDRDQYLSQQHCCLPLPAPEPGTPVCSVTSWACM